MAAPTLDCVFSLFNRQKASGLNPQREELTFQTHPADPRWAVATADRASRHWACYRPPRQSFVEGARRECCNSPTNPKRSAPDAKLSEFAANSFNLVRESGFAEHSPRPSRNSAVKTARLSENKCLNSEIPFCYLLTVGRMETSHLQSGDCNPRPCPGGGSSSRLAGQARAGHRGQT